MGATSKPPPLAQISRGGVKFFTQGNIWDTRAPCGQALLRPATPASTITVLHHTAPVSQWPTTTRWRQTNAQTNRTAPSRRGLDNLLHKPRESVENVTYTEINELVGYIEAGLEASTLDTGGGRGGVGPRVRRLTAAALRHELDVHAVAGRVDGHVRPPATVRTDRLAGVRRTVVDPHVVKRTAA